MGASVLHGAHHEAKTLRTTTFPRKERSERRTLEPRTGSATVGAWGRSPRATAASRPPSPLRVRPNASRATSAAATTAATTGNAARLTAPGYGRRSYCPGHVAPDRGLAGHPRPGPQLGRRVHPRAGDPPARAGPRVLARRPVRRGHRAGLRAHRAGPATAPAAAGQPGPRGAARAALELL